MDLRPGPHFVPLSGRPHLIFLMVRHLPPLFYDENQDLTSKSGLGWTILEVGVGPSVRPSTTIVNKHVWSIVQILHLSISKLQLLYAAYNMLQK